jgi:hypothetical protein
MPPVVRNNLRLDRLAYLLIAGHIILIPAVAAIAEPLCGPFTFNPLPDGDRTQRVSRALARVYAPSATSTEERHEGAATVIQNKPMLLVTAGHVTPKEIAKVNYPDLKDNRFYRATVVARSTNEPSAVGTTPPESRKLDFAVLLVEDPPLSGVEALEVWFDKELDETTHHDLASYARDSQDPLWGEGRAGFGNLHRAISGASA